MNQDDLDNYRDYDLRIRILESAKQSSEVDLETLIELQYNIDTLIKEQSDLALRMFEEGQL